MVELFKKVAFSKGSAFGDTPKCLELKSQTIVILPLRIKEKPVRFVRDRLFNVYSFWMAVVNTVFSAVFSFTTVSLSVPFSILITKPLSLLMQACKSSK